MLSHGFLNWTGGVGLLRVLLQGLERRTEVELPIRMMIPVPTRMDRHLRNAARVGLEACKSVTGLAPDWRPAQPPGLREIESWFEDLSQHVTFTSYSDGRGGLGRSLHTAQCDVVLPVFRSLGSRFPVPWVGYVYDFQHRYHPELFGVRERFMRNVAFNSMLRDAPVVVVNSKAVSDDIERFHPGHAAKVVTLSFAPAVQLEWFDADPRETRVQYGVPDRYFVVSNQFWVHKDHATAIRALKELHRNPTARDVALVCTGLAEDSRSPGHFPYLKSLIDELGLSNAVHILGLIPKAHQMALVRSAAAVVQPTRFEGGPGGGAGYDAVAVGTPLIASDIPVNREIDIGDVRFFQVGDANELSTRMADALAAVERPSVREVTERSLDRISQLGAQLVHAGALAIACSQMRSH